MTSFQTVSADIVVESNSGGSIVGARISSNFVKVTELLHRNANLDSLLAVSNYNSLYQNKRASESILVCLRNLYLSGTHRPVRHC